MIAVQQNWVEDKSYALKIEYVGFLAIHTRILKENLASK